MKWLLGTAINYNQSTGVLIINQRAFIETLAQSYGFPNVAEVRKSYIPMSESDSQSDAAMYSLSIVLSVGSSVIER